MSTGDWPLANDRVAAAELRDVLRRESFTGDGIQAAFGAEGAFTRDPADIPLYVRRLAPDAALSTLIKLFLLDVAVPRAEVEGVLAPLSLDRCAAMGVLHLQDELARATVNIFPYGDLVIASDQYEGEGQVRPDHVLGLSLSTRVLASITLRHFVGSALDIGTGSGVHALLAATHTHRSVGVDVNRRAIRFGEFNAALNGLDNVEFREGSVFEPVEGETFDLIVSNPPYVVSPDTEYVFRDSGLEGDSFTEGLIRSAPRFLNEDGLAHVLVEWAYRADEHWSAAPRRWVEGNGCDSLILHYSSQDPLSYAGTWNAELRQDPGAFASAIDRWVEYDRRLGIERISWGAIVLRRRSGPNWVKAIATELTRLGPAAEHVERLIGAQDYLVALGAELGLLQGVFELAGDHRFDQTFTISAGEGVLERSVLRVEGGLRTDCELDPFAVRIVTLLDGRRALQDVIEQAAADAPGSPSPEEFALQTLPTVAQLIALGLVVPADRRLDVQEPPGSAEGKGSPEPD